MSWMKHTVVLGLPRTGKTTFCVDLMEDLPAGQKCMFVNTQWENYFDELPGVQKHYGPPPSQGRGTEIQEADKQVWYIDMEREDDLIKWMWAMYQHQKRCKKLVPRTWFIDEAHQFFPKYQNVHSGDRTVKTIFTMGSKQNIRIVLISQKPQFLNVDLLRLCERKVFFKLDDADVTYLHNLHYSFEPVSENYEYEVIE